MLLIVWRTSTIFGTKFGIICAAKSLKIGLQLKILCQKLTSRGVHL